MPQPPKNVKKGDPVEAKEYNQVLSELRRLGRLFDQNRLGDGSSLRLDQVWWGVVVDTGPSSEDDYVDSRYWIQRSKIEQTESDADDEPVSFQKYIDGTDYKYEIVTATNLAEARLDSDADDVNLSSHRVQTGTNVVVLRFLDEGNPSTPRYFFWQPPSNLQRMRVKSEAGDYLRCVTYDGTDEGVETIRVAKPYELKRSPFDGNTINGKTYSYLSQNRREVIEGDRTLTQTIREQYYTDAEIYASYRPQGDTGVTSIDVYWIDANLGARRWQRDAYLLENCADSTDKQLVSGDLYDNIGGIVRLNNTGEICWKVFEAQCDCDLEEVVVSASFDTCDECLPKCVPLTRCSGETGGSASLNVKSSGNIADATVILYDGTCYEVGTEFTCVGDETELLPNEWEDYSSCDTCRVTCHTLTCCDSSDTLLVKGRGLLDLVGGTKAISVVGEPGCWTVGAAETCTSHVEIEYDAFDNCTDCNDEYCCYSTDPCPGQTGAPEIFTAYSVGECYSIGDIVKISIDGTTWCYEITNVLTGRDTCEIPCGNETGAGGAADRFYEITDTNIAESCDECTPCWAAKRCDDSAITDVFRGEFEQGKIYKISGNCWEITGPAECDGGATSDADSSDEYDDCISCVSGCYEITPCAGGTAILVSGNLEGISYICRDGTSYSVSTATCDGSEEPVGSFSELVDCDECPEGFVKKTVLTSFDEDTCEFTTEDICVKEIGCTE